VKLPVSGLEPRLRTPGGRDDLVLCEGAGAPVARSLALLGALSDDEDWAALTVTDFEVLLLGLRQRVLGDRCDLSFSCPDCRAPVEVSFTIADFLQDVVSTIPSWVRPLADRPGWYSCGTAAFRLPTAGDQAAVAGRSDAADRMAERCIEADHLPERTRGRIERAMAAMAPEVSRPLSGSCPECRTKVEAPLYVTRLVINELAREAVAVYDEIDLIARAYHWREAEILELPRQRRRAYAERIRRAA
jgi:hypothetical protein